MNNINLQLAGALGHEVADKRLDILRRIGEVGSISEAARAAGVSYKAAWQAIDTLSNLAGTALLERTVGGAGGGGAQLTAAGHQLLAAAELLHRTRAEVLARIALSHVAGAAPATPLPRLGGLGLRTSMRNQLPCTVEAITPHGQAMRVSLALPDGTALVSRITQESVELLGLRPGLAVLALCKATAVSVVPPATGATAPTGRHTGSNTLRARATRVSRAAAGGEVALALDCGLQLVGFSAAGGGITLNGPATALIDESAVVIALTD